MVAEQRRQLFHRHIAGAKVDLPTTSARPRIASRSTSGITGPARVSRASGMPSPDQREGVRAAAGCSCTSSRRRRTAPRAERRTVAKHHRLEHPGVVAVAADRDPADGRKVAEQSLRAPPPAPGPASRPGTPGRAGPGQPAGLLHRIGLPRDVVGQRVVGDVDHGRRPDQPRYGQKGGGVEHEAELAELGHVGPFPTQEARTRRQDSSRRTARARPDGAGGRPPSAASAFGCQVGSSDPTCRPSTREVSSGSGPVSRVTSCPASGQRCGELEGELEHPAAGEELDQDDAQRPLVSRAIRARRGEPRSSPRGGNTRRRAAASVGRSRSGGPSAPVASALAANAQRKGGRRPAARQVPPPARPQRPPPEAAAGTSRLPAPPLPDGTGTARNGWVSPSR